MKKITRIAKELGIKELYFYGLDEPRTEFQVEINKVISECAHKAGALTACAIINDKCRKQLENFIDVPIVNWAAQARGINEIFHLVTKRKKVPHKKVYYYANFSADHTLMNRLTFGLYLYKSGYDGNIPWAYYDIRRYWEPFPQSFPEDSPFIDSSTFYAFPTKDEPIPTLLFESAREGVDDLRYIRTLEKLLKTSRNKAMVRKAKENLKKILDQISLINKKGVLSANYMIPPEKYQEFRRILQDTILSLLRDKREGK